MSLEIIELGVVPVEFGAKADPKRIKKLVGNFFHWLDDELDPNRFLNIDQWPEGKIERELAVVCFGEFFETFVEAQEQIQALENWEGGSFPELMSVTDQLDELWRRGVHWLSAANPNSVWRSNDRGDLYAACLVCYPENRGLYVRWVEECWFKDDGFLVSRKSALRSSDS